MQERPRYLESACRTLCTFCISLPSSDSPSIISCRSFLASTKSEAAVERAESLLSERGKKPFLRSFLFLGKDTMVITFRLCAVVERTEHIDLDVHRVSHRPHKVLQLALDLFELVGHLDVVVLSQRK